MPQNVLDVVVCRTLYIIRCIYNEKEPKIIFFVTVKDLHGTTPEEVEYSAWKVDVLRVERRKTMKNLEGIVGVNLNAFPERPKESDQVRNITTLR